MILGFRKLSLDLYHITYCIWYKLYRLFSYSFLRGQHIRNLARLKDFSSESARYQMPRISNFKSRWAGRPYKAISNTFVKCFVSQTFSKQNRSQNESKPIKKERKYLPQLVDLRSVLVSSCVGSDSRSVLEGVFSLRMIFFMLNLEENFGL